MTLRIPLLIFFLYLLHGSFLGLSDDEAYYWVWSQFPSWSYAYHPPMAGWLITLFSFTGLVRLPAALIVAVLLWLTALWMRREGVLKSRIEFALIALLSFAGFFSLSWMIVPDTPLYLGWIIAFYSASNLCFSKYSIKNIFLLALGIWIAMLSKYSGVLIPLSSMIAIWIWGSKHVKKMGSIAIIIGSVLAAIPVLIWNSQHEWASLLYQVSERHGGDVSLLRYGRFWLIQFLLAGPGLFFYAWSLFQKKKITRAEKYILVWAIPPALVFGLQPLISDFKPHWAFAAWLPIALGFAVNVGLGKTRVILLKTQLVYGLCVTVFIFIACHIPLGGMLFHLKDSRWDVTNDFYGWEVLRTLVKENIPIMGNRYQTAAQAAYAMRDAQRVSMVPRDIKARDEWADFEAKGIVDSNGPDWPRLKKPAYFIADHRYADAPEFRNAHCQSLGRAETRRGSYLAKWIEIWKCVPQL